MGDDDEVFVGQILDERLRGSGGVAMVGQRVGNLYADGGGFVGEGFAEELFGLDFQRVAVDQAKRGPVADAGIFGGKILGEGGFIGGANLSGGTLDGTHFHLATLAEFPAGFLVKHLPRLALGKEAQIDSVADVFMVGVAEAFENFLMRLGAGEVFQILRVDLAIVQFLNGTRGAGIVPLGVGHFFALGQAIKLVADFAFVGPGGGLVVAEVWHVVADVKVSAVAHGAGEIAHFVHAIAVAVHVTARRGGIRAEKGFALHSLGDRLAKQVQHGGRVVDEAHETIGGAAGFAGGELLPFFREPYEQGHVHAAIEQGAFVAGHAAAVVAVEKHDRVFCKAVFFQLFQDRAHLQIHRAYAIVEARQLAADEWGVRIIQRHRHLGGVVDGARRQRTLHLLPKARVGPHHRAALVRGHQVKHTEKRLRFIASLSPVGGGAAFVPRGLDDLRVIGRVVIGLHVVARVKPLRPQQRRKPAHAFRNGKARPHLLRAQRSGITTGNQTRPRRRTHRRTRKRLGVAHALLGQSVDIRRHRKLVAVTAEHGAHVFGRDPKDVWPISRLQSDTQSQ